MLRERDPERDQERGARDRDPARVGASRAATGGTRSRARRAARRGRPRAASRLGASALTRGPSTASSAGSTVSASVAASSATIAPAIPIEYRNRCGKIVSDAIAAAIVSELNTIVRPAVWSVRFSASGPKPNSRRLLAVAGDHEQAVVDRQPEARARSTKFSANTDRSTKLGDDPQREERHHDRQAAEQRRQQRRDQRAEEQQRQQEDEREREQLGVREVVADLRC